MKKIFVNKTCKLYLSFSKFSKLTKLPQLEIKLDLEKKYKRNIRCKKKYVKRMSLEINYEEIIFKI